MTRTDAHAHDVFGTLLRLFAWGTVTITFAFLLEAWLVYWQGQSPASRMLRGTGGYWAAAGYAVAVAVAVILALRPVSLLGDAARIDGLVAYIARAAFFSVLFIGMADATVSFLRVEGLLSALVGSETAGLLGQTRWRAAYVHTPFFLAGLVAGFFTRTLGFIWLALLVVVVQLVLVIGRYVFSYEQALIADLVRMWYAALFLFASAYLLVEDGHVRVDIFYSTMTRRAKALVNGLGAVLIGMTMCWTILIVATASNASPIVGPFLRFEQGQQSYGMMTKYLLAIYLGVFAVTMMFQFASVVLKSLAEWRSLGESVPEDQQKRELKPMEG
ncbi:TRAP transporter small permease subunit [Neoaquamicrobium sediminum]|uniref:TRAP transporter small permease subunit n=1 Tax=Neoaquamicrobium sediminum TaxID=1849104 RepID=UPI0015672853|nr:TRAP transporter small permease subunit [Mesorhizobium sediminum]NRC57275.1 TRAP transporter small permease subunit [Mesorhizobium sediminum]